MFAIINAVQKGHLIGAVNKNLKPRREDGRNSPLTLQVDMVQTRRNIEVTPQPSPNSTPPLKPSNPFLNIPHGCNVCQALIHDWLILPLVKEEKFAGKIRPRALKRSAGDIAEILYRLIMNDISCKEIIQLEFEIMIILEARKYNENWLEDQIIPEENIHAFKEAEKKLFLEVISDNETRYDMDALKSLVEDKGCLNRDVDVEDWVGFWIMTLWNFIPTLHLEHQKLKPASGGGRPAPGLRSFRTLPATATAPTAAAATATAAAPTAAAAATANAANAAPTTAAAATATTAAAAAAAAAPTTAATAANAAPTTAATAAAATAAAAAPTTAANAAAATAAAATAAAAPTAAAEMQLPPISSISSIPSNLVDSLVQIIFEIDHLYS